MAYTVPDLPYDYNALEPHIDEQTMRIHHDKHHTAYVNNANKALEKYPDLAKMNVEELLRNIDKAPQDIKQALINNAGGHSNHSIFWTIMAPAGKGGGGEPTGELAKDINDTFGSFEKFKETLSNAAATRFGSGWAWLLLGKDGKLKVEAFLNQDSPYMTGSTPLVGIDVWEHAYYLKYQNRRPDYIAAWWNVINWSEVANRYMRAKQGG